MIFSYGPTTESLQTLLTSIFFKCTINKLKLKLKKKEVI